MGTVWTFGDSLTEGFKSGETWAKTYVEWKGYVPMTYGEIIANKLNFELINLGKGGLDNYSILECFIKNIEKIKKNDIVILGWSDVGRFRLATKNDTWISLVPNFTNLTNMENISLNTINEMSVNRLSKVYIEELNIWINFFNHVIRDFQVISWSNFNLGKLDSIFIHGVEQIKKETNGEINDWHFSEKGQKQLAETLLDEIKKP